LWRRGRKRIWTKCPETAEKEKESQEILERSKRGKKDSLETTRGGGQKETRRKKEGDGMYILSTVRKREAEIPRNPEESEPPVKRGLI